MSQTYTWNVYTFFENVGNILLILWNISYYIWNIGPSPCWIITILQLWSFSFFPNRYIPKRFKSSITSTRSWGADIASKCKLWLLTCSQRWTLPFKLRSRIVSWRTRRSIAIQAWHAVLGGAFEDEVRGAHCPLLDVCPDFFFLFSIVSQPPPDLDAGLWSVISLSQLQQVGQIVWSVLVYILRLWTKYRPSKQ